MMCPMDEVTKQGYDMQFGTNVLGNIHGRPKGGIDYASVKDGPQRTQAKLWTGTAYFQSKSGNVVFAKELARRYGNEGIVATSLNPEIIRTELGRYLDDILALMTRLLGTPADPLGATTHLYAGTAPDAASLNGQYLVLWARLTPAMKDTDDPTAGQTLWDWVEEQVKNVLVINRPLASCLRQSGRTRESERYCRGLLYIHT